MSYIPRLKKDYKESATKATIVIAHRLSTILNSNKIFVVDNGEISDEGTHEQLLQKSSIYKNFYEKQIRKN